MEMPEGWNNLKTVSNEKYEYPETYLSNKKVNIMLDLMKEMAEALDSCQIELHMLSCGIECRCEIEALKKFKEWK